MPLGCFAGFAGFDCSILWIIMILIFFLTAMARRQITDFGYDFSLIGGAILGELVFIVAIFVTHSFKWSLLLGILGALIGGFISSPFLPDGGGDEIG